VAAAYRAVRVFDGTSEGVIEDGAVVVEDGHIASVGPARGLAPNTETVDLDDVTLMPGLIDAHVHLVWDASAEPHEVVARRSRALTVLRCAKTQPSTCALASPPSGTSAPQMVWRSRSAAPWSSGSSPVQEW
jgi:imidazolonepropionase-like amidohydrolase